ncbi:ninjurin-1 isoform X4 [Neoarius graeffei]|uniref:ninjurin-1 isoform X4 n=1 Tax=Neoarius graeffei TaxID=443677 RepID=UPI00298CB7F3|nr:ninjurin-1 isoform X4 [Neoarius graeffei]
MERNLHCDQREKARWRLDMNRYATKKSTAQSMLDMALLMANSSQLKTALQEGPEYRFHLIALIILSLTLQVIVGLLLMFIVKHNLNDERKQPKLNMLNNMATVFVFITLLINVLITALGSHSGQ